MKKIIIGLFIILFALSFSMIADAGQRQSNRRQDQHQNYQKKQAPRYYGQGYRYNYHGRRNYHPEHYRGHWRSWRAWEDYYNHHRHECRNGRYYRKDNSLYFEFENDEGRFVFSIGR